MPSPAFRYHAFISCAPEDNRAPGRHWAATVWAIVIAVAAALLAWICVDAGLLTASLNF